MTTNSVIDWSQFQELRELQTAGEPDVIEQLIATFLEDSEVRMARLLAAASAGDAVVVMREAHTVKSNASVFGAEKLRSVAEQVETGAISNLASVLPFVADLRVALTEVQGALAMGVP